MPVPYGYPEQQYCKMYFQPAPGYNEPLSGYPDDNPEDIQSPRFPGMINHPGYTLNGPTHNMGPEAYVCLGEENLIFGYGGNTFRETGTPPVTGIGTPHLDTGTSVKFEDLEPSGLQGESFG